MTSPRGLSEKRYDVSLSYAGEDRPYVSQVATFLQANGIRVFYDEFEETELWGKDLVDELDRIYRLDSEAVILFVSKAYREKDWTNHERKSVLAAALRARREYVLPVRFDDTELDGLPPTKKWLDARKLTPIALAQSVFKKLVALGITMAKSEVPPRSPGAIAWRIARRHFGTDLIGSANAAGRFGGRWNPRGIPVLYAGASFCTALLEVLARLPAATNVTDYIAMPIRIQASVAIETLYESSLPPGWRSLSLRQSDVLRQIGANWLQSRRTCVLSVPSAAVRNERLFLLNPTHPEFSSLEVLTPEPLDLDPRLFRAT